MQVFRNFLTILSLQTILIISLSLISTFLCLKFNLVAKIPSGLLGIAIVFPIVFLIDAAYRRREEALSHFAGFKTAAVALFFAHRDWTGNANQDDVKQVQRIISSIFQAVQSNFTHFNERNKDFTHIYQLFSQLSLSNENLRKLGVYGSEISRASQYLQVMMANFEKMRNVYIYRTPISLRAYTQISLNMFPIVFGPYFAYLSNQFFMSCGFVVAAIYSLLLVCLDNIQHDLENPYDGIGTDDINLNITNEYTNIMIGEENENSTVLTS